MDDLHNGSIPKHDWHLQVLTLIRCDGWPRRYTRDHRTEAHKRRVQNLEEEHTVSLRHAMGVSIKSFQCHGLLHDANYMSDGHWNGQRWQRSGFRTRNSTYNSPSFYSACGSLLLGWKELNSQNTVFSLEQTLRILKTNMSKLRE